jgi:hypothetical protein
VRKWKEKKGVENGGKKEEVENGGREEGEAR